MILRILLCALFLQTAVSEEWALPFSYTENLCFERSSAPRRVSGGTLFLFEPKETAFYLGHFFHMLEHIVGIWAYYGNDHFQDVSLIVLTDHTNWEGPNQINRHLLKALFPYAEIKLWGEFKNRDLCFERAIQSDRSLTFHSKECTRLNKMLGEARHSLSKGALECLADRVHAYVGTKICSSQNLRITYLKRPFPRTLSSSIEQKLLSSIDSLQNVTLRVEDFASFSFHKQIEIIGNTDLLIGVHGNGLSHLLFLPVGACVIEIFPPGSHHLDYRLLANARGLRYHGLIADRGIISDEESYRIGPFGEVDQTIGALDIDLVLQIIRSYE